MYYLLSKWGLMLVYPLLRVIGFDHLCVDGGVVFADPCAHAWTELQHM